jgi:hypothetical protein
MDCSIISTKKGIGSILLVLFYVHLQASEEKLLRFSTSLKPVEVMESFVEMCTHIHEAEYQTLTPKEREIADLTRYRFYQLQQNSPTYESPFIGLCAIIDLCDRLKNDSDELLFTSCERLAKVAEDLPNTLSQSVAKASQLIDRPVLYIEVGNKFCSLGPIDIARRIILAKLSKSGEDVELLKRKSRFRDCELIALIRSCSENTIIVCYNSYLKRSIFLLPKENGKVVIAKDSDLETRNERKIAILKIKRRRFYRNATIFTVPPLLASGLYWKKSLLQFPIVKRISLGSSAVGKFFRQFGRRVSDGLCSAFCILKEVIRE